MKRQPNHVFLVDGEKFLRATQDYSVPQLRERSNVSESTIRNLQNSPTDDPHRASARTLKKLDSVLETKHTEYVTIRVMDASPPIATNLQSLAAEMQSLEEEANEGPDASSPTNGDWSGEYCVTLQSYGLKGGQMLPDPCLINFGAEITQTRQTLEVAVRDELGVVTGSAMLNMPESFHCDAYSGPALGEMVEQVAQSGPTLTGTAKDGSGRQRPTRAAKRQVRNLIVQTVGSLIMASPNLPRALGEVRWQKNQYAWFSGRPKKAAFSGHLLELFVGDSNGPNVGMRVRAELQATRKNPLPRRPR